jgi:peptidoglycan/LPS O-acetylase OafA/YrhL
LEDEVKSGYVPALDGLRGAAILLVLLRHAVALPLQPATPVDAAVAAVARFGWTGVDLFFVLSGFLITGILLDTKGQPRWWPNFFVRRGLRIFPLYYGALAVIFILVPRLVEWSNPDYAVLRDHQAWYWTYTVNFLNAFTHGRGTPLYTAHFWSLAIEEQFYLIWPLFVWRCRPETLLRVAVLAAIAGLAWRLGVVLHDPADAAGAFVLTPGRLDGLMTGAALAVVARRANGLQAFTAWAPRVLSLAAVAVVALAVTRGGLEYHDPVVSVVAYPVVAIGYGALLVASLGAAPGSLLARTLCNATLRRWGKYSYGLYVVHYPLLGMLQAHCRWCDRGVGMLGGSRLPAVLAFALIVAAGSYALAWLSYHVYEGPLLGLKRYFGPRPTDRASAPLASSHAG